jgi:type III pantothenate kinase
MGVFENENLVATWRMATDTNRMPDEYAILIRNMLPMKNILVESISGVSICSVVPPLTQVFQELSSSYFKIDPLVVSAGTKTGVRIEYENPRDVGSDRVVDAAAAYDIYGGPIVIVDFGTATVFDAVSKDGTYIGGAIASGINLTAQALYERTAQLRKVELIPPKNAIGKNTTASIQSGIFYGHVGMVEAMVERFKKEMGDGVKVVATGGMAQIIDQETDVFDEINMDLTLIGLRLIYELNLNNETKM